jgi:hypothetical protein
LMIGRNDGGTGVPDHDTQVRVHAADV